MPTAVEVRICKRTQRAGRSGVVSKETHPDERSRLYKILIHMKLGCAVFSLAVCSDVIRTAAIFDLASSHISVPKP